jgi:hypothetical protein
MHWGMLHYSVPCVANKLLDKAHCRDSSTGPLLPWHPCMRELQQKDPDGTGGYVHVYNVCA